MVAEVVLSVMGNRSDRRFPNLSCAWALEAVWLTRRRRADFHQGQERTMKLLKQAEYMAATGLTLIRQTTFAWGWVHIRHRELRLPLRRPLCLYGSRPREVPTDEAQNRCQSAPRCAPARPSHPAVLRRRSSRRCDAFRLRAFLARSRLAKLRSRQYRADASPALRCRARRPVCELNNSMAGI